MSATTATVYVFEGAAYYGRPGVVFSPARVSEDFAPYRKAECKDWPHIEKWLLSRGYRCLGKTGSKHDGATLRQWWGLTDVFGTQAKDENGNPVPMRPDQIKARFEAWQQQSKAEAERQDALDQHSAMRALSLRNRVLADIDDLPDLYARHLMQAYGFAAGLDALDHQSPHFEKDMELQEIIYCGLQHLIEREHDLADAPAKQAELEPEQVMTFTYRHHIYWVVDHEVEPAEWMASRGYPPQGYGPGKGKAVEPGQKAAGKVMPGWAKFMVWHADTCE